MGSWKPSDLPDAVPVVRTTGRSHGRGERLGLVRPQRLDARARERGGDVGMEIGGDRRHARRARVLGGLGDEPLVVPPGLEERVPRLDLADHGHDLPW